MTKEIKALEELSDLLREEYEKSLQSEEGTQVAYRSGVLYGIALSIITLKELEQDKEVCKK